MIVIIFYSCLPVKHGICEVWNLGNKRIRTIFIWYVLNDWWSYRKSFFEFAIFEVAINLIVIPELSCIFPLPEKARSGGM